MKEGHRYLPSFALPQRTVSAVRTPRDFASETFRGFRGRWAWDGVPAAGGGTGRET